MAPLHHDATHVPRETGHSGIIPPSPQRVDHRQIDSQDTRFWTAMRPAEFTSDECLSKVQALQSCPFKISLVRDFGEDEAQAFVNFLDQVI